MRAGESALDKAEARHNLMWVIASAVVAALVMYLDMLGFRAADLLAFAHHHGPHVYRGADILSRRVDCPAQSHRQHGHAGCPRHQRCVRIFGPDDISPTGFSPARDFFDTAAELILFIRFGKYLEARAQRPCDGRAALAAQPGARHRDRGAGRQGDQYRGERGPRRGCRYRAAGHANSGRRRRRQRGERGRRIDAHWGIDAGRERAGRHRRRRNVEHFGRADYFARPASARILHSHKS